MTTVHGHVEPGFERVADAFLLNITDRDEVGAACSVVIDGTSVVDVWAGTGRGGTPWTRATRTAVFSVSKAVTAICLLMAADRGLLDLDAPVASYWPEFATHGKGAITVRHALAHRTGVIGFTQPWSAESLAAWDPIVEDLAGQSPLWEPDTAFAYHPVSVGFLAGEVLRRATGLRPSEWLARYVTEPLGLLMTYGADADHPELAPVVLPARGTLEIPLSLQDHEQLVLRSVLADGAYGPDLFSAATTARFLGPESPAANVVTRARDLARLFSAVVSTVDGVRLVGDSVLEEATRPLSYGKPFLGPDKGDVWGTGFMLHSARRGMAGPGSFGHDGAGGHLAFAHPGLGLGFGYHTSRAGGDDDIRAEALCAALRESL